MKLMDNFKVNIYAEGKDTLQVALSLFDRRKTIGWQVKIVNKRPRLILFWSTSSVALGVITPLPAPLDTAGAADFVWNWLQHADYGPEPDHDGDNGKGFHVWCDDWGHVEELWQAFVAIEPEWAMYGK